MKSIPGSQFAGDSYTLNKQTLTVSKEKNKATSLLLLSLTQTVPASWHLLFIFIFFCVNERKLGFCWYYCLPVVLDSWLSRSEPVRFQWYRLWTTHSYLYSSKGKFLCTRSSLTIEDSWKYIWGLDFLYQITNLVLKLTLNFLLPSSFWVIYGQMISIY